jgi:hypothetical protein
MEECGELHPPSFGEMQLLPLTWEEEQTPFSLQPAEPAPPSWQPSSDSVPLQGTAQPEAVCSRQQ